MMGRTHFSLSLQLHLRICFTSQNSFPAGTPPCIVVDQAHPCMVVDQAHPSTTSTPLGHSLTRTLQQIVITM